MFNMSKNGIITLTRGDTLRVPVGLSIGNGFDIQPYEPSNEDSIRFAMKKSWNSPRTLIRKHIPSQTLLLQLDPSDTKKLPFGRYVYDIEITFANGDVDTFIKGELILAEEIE